MNNNVTQDNDDAPQAALPDEDSHPDLGLSLTGESGRLEKSAEIRDFYLQLDQLKYKPKEKTLQSIFQYAQGRPNT